MAEVIDAALQDEGLKPLARAAIEHRILRAAASSPQALRAVAQTLAGNASSDTIIADLAGEVLPTWREPKAVEAFLDWLQAYSPREPLRRQIRQWRAAYGKGKVSRNLTPPQRAVLTRLHQLADLFEARAEHGWGIRPRTNPLVVGPSGSGKSWIMDTFARERGAGFLRLTYGSWTVRGAKSGKPAIEQITDIILWHPFSIICIDELDNVGAGLSSDWSVAMRDELFALLDGRLLDDIRLKPGPHKLPEPGQVLRERVMIVGSGTWQDLWQREDRTVGFQSAGTSNVSTRIDSSKAISEELRRRFDARLLCLPPIGVEELRQMAAADGIETTAALLGVKVDYAAGEASGLGVRWLENLRTDLELVRVGVCPRSLGLEALSVQEQFNPQNL